MNDIEMICSQLAKLNGDVDDNRKAIKRITAELEMIVSIEEELMKEVKKLNSETVKTQKIDGENV